MLHKFFKIALASAEIDASDFARHNNTNRTNLYNALNNSNNSPSVQVVRQKVIDFINSEFGKLHIRFDNLKRLNNSQYIV